MDATDNAERMKLPEVKPNKSTGKTAREKPHRVMRYVQLYADTQGVKGALCP